MNTTPGASSAAAAAAATANTGMSPIRRSPGHRRDTSSESGKKRIPSEQWEAKRAIITQLYQEEKKSLKEVMDYLEKEHGFNATVKMFKSRILKWGLDKKLKSDEVFAILVLKRDRDLANKPSEFMIRGQPVDMDNINRYVKRNPQLIARLNAGDMPSNESIKQVMCRTPSPQPLSQLVTTNGGTPITIVTPPQQREVLLLLKEYIEESFYCGRWRWEYNVSCTTRAVEDQSIELFERTLTSLALVNRCMARNETNPLGLVVQPSFASLEEMLEPAFAALKELVAVQSPIFATRMLSLLWFLDTHHKSGLLQLIVTQLAALVVDILGPQHRMARIWGILASDPTFDYRELCESAYATLVLLLEQRIGPANLITTMMYGDHVDYLFHSGRLDEAMVVCTEYQAKAEKSGRQHAWIAELGAIKRAIGDAQEDINGTIAAMDLELTNNNPEDLVPKGDERRAEVLLRQGNLEMQAGQLSSAAIQYSQAVHILESSSGDGGPDQRLLLTSLANLETAQTRLGEGQAAAGTRAARMSLQGAFATETNTLAAEQRRTRGSLSSSSGVSMASAADGRRGSSAGAVVTGGESIGATATATAGGWGAAVPSPGLSGSEVGWGWSPEAFVSPRPVMDDWPQPR